MWAKLASAALVSGGIASIGLYLAGIIGGYSRYLSPQLAFLLYVIGMGIGVIMTLAGVIDLRMNGSSGKTVLVLCFAILPACNLIYALIEARNIPSINDISTDLVFPPEFHDDLKAKDNTGKSLKFPINFKKEIEANYPDISPLALTISVDDVLVKSIQVIEGMPSWEITSKQIGAKETIIEGTITSTVFGFVDDFTIRLKQPVGGGGCVVDMRSRSRMGKSDLGKNAEHIRRYMELIQ